MCVPARSCGPSSRRLTHLSLDSVIATGDPNAYATAGMTYWPSYSTGSQRQVRFHGNSTTVEEDTERQEARAFWRSVPDLLEH